MEKQSSDDGPGLGYMCQYSMSASGQKQLTLFFFANGDLEQRTSCNCLLLCSKGFSESFSTHSILERNLFKGELKCNEIKWRFVNGETDMSFQLIHKHKLRDDTTM